jgi:SOS-response transcriptional repressor LexA
MEKEIDTVKAKVLNIMQKRGINYRQLAEMAGIDFYSCRNWLDGKILKPQYTTVLRIVRALNLDAPNASAPYCGEVRGGAPIVINPFNEDTPLIPVPFHVRDGYVLRLVGDSMNEEIPTNYLLLIDPHIGFINELDNKIVIINVDGEGSCKKYLHSIRQAVPCSTDLISHKSISLKSPETQIIGVVRHAFKSWGV